jgi:DNA-binding transcriptional LysR family regulator
VVVERARRIQRELDALRQDVSMIQGLERGTASLGLVGTTSRWLAPAVIAELRRRAPGLQLRVHESASERLANEVAEQDLAQAIVTEPVLDDRLEVEHLLDEDLVVLIPDDPVLLGGARHVLADGPIGLADLAGQRLILPPRANPLRAEVEQAARAAGIELDVPLEVEGVRLIPDLVAAGAGVTIMPETAAPSGVPGVRAVPMADMPPRRLALVTARGGYLTLADQTVRAVVRELVASERPARVTPRATP